MPIRMNLVCQHSCTCQAVCYVFFSVRSLARFIPWHPYIKHICLFVDIIVYKMTDKLCLRQHPLHNAHSACEFVKFPLVRKIRNWSGFCFVSFSFCSEYIWAKCDREKSRWEKYVLNKPTQFKSNYSSPALSSDQKRSSEYIVEEWNRERHTIRSANELIYERINSEWSAKKSHMGSDDGRTKRRPLASPENRNSWHRLMGLPYRYGTFHFILVLSLIKPFNRSFDTRLWWLFRSYFFLYPPSFCF